MTLVELMMALAILAIGMGALTNLLVVAITTNNRNSKDTSATLLAQMIVEQISAQHPNSSATISVTDCAGNAWTVATAGGASPNGAGANLVTTSTSIGYGGIDPNQAYSSITANVCGLRWSREHGYSDHVRRSLECHNHQRKLHTAGHRVRASGKRQYAGRDSVCVPRESSGRLWAIAAAGSCSIFWG